MLFTKEQLDALQQAASAAVVAEKQYHIPAELTIAQWALESGWGKYAPGNNCFGIKALNTFTGNRDRQLLHTVEWFTDIELQQFLNLGEGRTATLSAPLQSNGLRHLYSVVDYFAVFDTLADCFAARVRLLLSYFRNPLAVYISDRDFPAFVRSIAVKYSTSPNYADTILSIVRMPDVSQAIATARSAAG